MNKIIALVALTLSSFIIHAQTIDWINYIKEGGKFRVSMSKDIGTIVSNKAYTVTYNKLTGEFSATGYHRNSGNVQTYTYVGGNVDNSVFNIWGAAFVFDGAGNVYQANYGLVGTMVKVE
jgi:hypothetical protein